MSQQWYVRTRKGHAGPFSATRLRKLAEEGKVRPDSQLSLDLATWVPASRVRGLVFGPSARQRPRTRLRQNIIAA